MTDHRKQQPWSWFIFRLLSWLWCVNLTGVLTSIWRATFASIVPEALTQISNIQPSPTRDTSPPLWGRFGPGTTRTCRPSIESTSSSSLVTVSTRSSLSSWEAPSCLCPKITRTTSYEICTTLFRGIRPTTSLKLWDIRRKVERSVSESPLKLVQITAWNVTWATCLPMAVHDWKSVFRWDVIFHPEYGSRVFFCGGHIG